MTSPYSYTDPDGNRLEVAPSSDSHAVDLTAIPAGSRRRTTIKVPAWKLGDLVAALYRDAGETVPVMINPAEVAEDWVRLPRSSRGAVRRAS